GQRDVEGTDGDSPTWESHGPPHIVQDWRWTDRTLGPRLRHGGRNDEFFERLGRGMALVVTRVIRLIR
ncbi:MAG TPA: hypothetical protein VFH61_12975, partial [Thermoleophilia bacterium]|nr:hypothetical protein [Thermoleophilia bacterium]